MKNFFTYLFSLFLFMAVLATNSYAQNTTATKEQQIKALEELLSRPNLDAKEATKARTQLAELKGQPAPKQTVPLTEAEEQKKMHETLSPAEYDAWKRNKALSKQQTIPNAKTN